MRALALLAALTLLPLPVRADEATPRPDKPRGSYRLDYVLYEVESGKRAHERAYTLTVNEGSHGQLRTGTRVPVAGEKGPSYMDVGLRIGGRVLERDGDVSLESEIEMSTIAPGENVPAGSAPSLRTVSQSFSVRPVLGKPALVSSLDDPAGGRKLQAEVTVTRLK